jgi:hypothetical protein
MTGLYAESHGIVANVNALFDVLCTLLTSLKNFWDPVTQEEFHYNQAESAWKSTWWLGEPVGLHLAFGFNDPYSWA